MIKGAFYLQRASFIMDVNFCFPTKGLSILQGPSGAGKSLFLRCLAGLERAQKGLLLINNDCWEDSQKHIFVPTHKRNIGFVFQDHNLFPHLTPMQNLTFGYKRLKHNQNKIQPDNVIQFLGLQRLLSQPIDTLSGGEKQRLSIGRALLTNPDLLLMDEPVTSLDEASKNEVLYYIKALQRAFSFTILYVTHGLDEIKQLEVKPMILKQGKLQ